MKKTFTQALQEIQAEDVQRLNNYLEEGFTLLLDRFLQTSSGVITGLTTTQNGASGLTVSTGAIYMNGVFGELESSSGVTVTLPSSGTRTDLLVCYYQEIEDTPTTGYVLADPLTREETIVTQNTRKFGACRIELLTNTTYAGRPSNKIPLFVITSSSSTITGVSDVRIYAAIQRLQLDIQQNFKNMFYSGF